MVLVDVRKQRGDKGEQLVAEYLEQDGFAIVERNYACRTGEVDLIAKRGETVVFVEVKARTNSFFDLTELISKAKQRRIISAAKRFIVEHAVNNKVCRFDVALIEHLDSGKISYIPNAFTENEYC
jgi:TIGR00252 family protein